MKNKFLSLIISVSCLGLTVCSSVTKLDTDKVYECDFKSLSLNTKIVTEFNGSEVTIKGDILKFVEDPLEMLDKDNKVLAYAGDDFNFINQDDHAIYVNDKVACIVGGDFGMLTNHYTIYDTEYKELASADFDAFDTYGSIT